MTSGILFYFNGLAIVDLIVADLISLPVSSTLAPIVLIVILRTAGRADHPTLIVVVFVLMRLMSDELLLFRGRGLGTTLDEFQLFFSSLFRLLLCADGNLGRLLSRGGWGRQRAATALSHNDRGRLFETDVDILGTAMTLPLGTLALVVVGSPGVMIDFVIVSFALSNRRPARDVSLDSDLAEVAISAGRRGALSLIVSRASVVVSAGVSLESKFADGGIVVIVASRRCSGWSVRGS